MIRFGPAGNSESFYAQGYKNSWQAPGWLKGMGLSAYEYSFGRGVRLKEETARAIGAEAARFGIQMSVHMPYFINFLSTFCTTAPVYLSSEQTIMHPKGDVRLAVQDFFNVGVTA